MSTIKVNNIKTRSGTAITVGENTDTTTIPGAATVTGTLTNNSGGGIGNNALTNNSITVNGITIALGASGTIPVVDTAPTVTGATIMTPDAGQSTTLTGTNFTAQSSVELFSSTGVITEAGQVQFTSSTSISATFTNAVSAGTYFVRVTNNDGGTGTSATAILTVSAGPAWTTNAGSVGSVSAGASWGTINLVATGDNPLTYTEAPGTANALSVMGLSLANSANTGVLTGTAISPGSTTTYNFTIRVTDNDSQSTDRTFSVTINVGLTGGTQFN
tara:strand:+ start:775 stop:1596 length:822 start_codon:yes stop_codon:yes gene_type:complete